ncbi:MAG: hypothetical protein ACOYOV_05110 [Bacteroidales bacterium]
MKKIILVIDNFGNELIRVAGSLVQNENNSIEIDVTVPDYLNGKYSSFEFQLPDGSKPKYPLEIIENNKILFPLPGEVCKSIIYFEVIFTATNFVQKTKRYKLELSEDINASDDPQNNFTDLITAFELRVTAVEESTQNFILNNETSIVIGSVVSGEVPFVENVGTAKDQVWNIVLAKGDTGKGISSISLLSTVGLIKTYRITFSDANIFDFSVTDGSKGDTGNTGANLTFGSNFTTALPVTPGLNIRYPYAGTNGTVIGGITWNTGDDAQWNGTSWQKIPSQLSSNYYNKTENLEVLSYLRGIFRELKSTPVGSAFTTYLANITPTSTFVGWRRKCNFQANFMSAEMALCSNAPVGTKLYGYVWTEAGVIVATAAAYTTQASGVLAPIMFIFDREITSSLLGGTKFYIGFRGLNDNYIFMSDSSGTGDGGSGLYDTTANTQYCAFGSPLVPNNNGHWTNTVDTTSYKAYLRLYSAETTISIVSLINSTVNSVAPALFTSQGLINVGAAFKEYFTNTASSSVITPSATNGGNSYSSVFTGWGAVFNKVNVSFNALFVKNIKRNTGFATDKKWKYIQAFVKNNVSDATPLAKSMLIEVDPELITLSDLTFPLMNNDLTSFVTLTDASFSGSTYFVGYIFYNSAKACAGGGTQTGTQSNYEGHSYYQTGSNISYTGWAEYAGNACIPFEHLLLENLTAVKLLRELVPVQTQITNIAAAVAALQPASVSVILPDTIYAIVGDKLQLFFRGIIKAVSPYDYDILVTCTKGSKYPRYFEYTPVLADVGTTTFKIEVKDKDGNIVGTKTCNIVTKSAVQSPIAVKKILCVGDSLTSSGIWCQEASRRLIGTAGTPAGLALTNISFVGRKSGGGIGFEGTGGWSWGNYSTAGATAYRFIVSGIVTPPALDSTYTNNGQTFTVAEINLTNGSGNIRCLATGAPAASGTLTRTGGTGDATITFSSQSQDVSNPFWNFGTNQLDIVTYVNTYCGGTIDVMYILLSWNSRVVNQTDFSSDVNAAKVLINHIHAQFPNCKFKVMGVQVPSLNGGMGANYGATGTSYADQFGMVKTALNMNIAYQAFANEVAYSSFVEFVAVSSQFDSENNMPQADVAVNSRSAITEKRGTNGVHPDTPGYYQIADVVFRNFVANFCQ